MEKVKMLRIVLEKRRRGRERGRERERAGERVVRKSGIRRGSGSIEIVNDRGVCHVECGLGREIVILGGVKGSVGEVTHHHCQFPFNDLIERVGRRSEHILSANKRRERREREGRDGSVWRECPVCHNLKVVRRIVKELRSVVVKPSNYRSIRRCCLFISVRWEPKPSVDVHPTVCQRRSEVRGYVYKRKRKRWHL